MKVEGRARVGYLGHLPFKGRTIRKVMGGGGGGGNFELKDVFSLSNSLYECFLGHSMNIF